MSETLYECFGAPADYVAAFDAVDGQTGDGVRYPEPRVFLEAQSHLHPPGETARHHFEHIHVGMCFPFRETWVQPNLERRIDVRVVFHNVQNYTVTAMGATFVYGGGAGGGMIATPAQVAELNAAAQASADSVQTVFQSYVTVKKFGLNCDVTFRPELKVIRSNPDALVDEWFAAGEWGTNINYEGQGACVPEPNSGLIRSRSWIAPNGGYIYDTLEGIPPASQLAAPVSGSLDFIAQGPTAPFSVYIDPDFHVHDPNSPNGDDLGIWHQDFGPLTTTRTDISVPLDGVPPGLHRLVTVVDRADQSAIQVVPFQVAARVPTCDEQIAELEAEVARLNDIIDRSALVLEEK